MATVVLTHGAAKVEVPNVSGYEDLAREAEGQFGLRPESYSFFDQYGAIEGSKLHRALQGPCILEVRERPEWRRMREMSEQIEALMASQQGTSVARAAGLSESELDAKIQAKVDAAVAQLKEDLSRSDAQVERVGAPVDLGIDVQAMKEKLDQLEESFKALPMAAPQSSQAVDDAAGAKLQAACHKASLMAADLEDLLAQAGRFQATFDVERPPSSSPLAPMRRFDASPASPARTLGHFGSGPQWQDVLASKKSASATYATGFAPKTWGEAALEDLRAMEISSSPFMGSSHLSPAKLNHKQMQGCRSLPFLPRVC